MYSTQLYVSYATAAGRRRGGKEIHYWTHFPNFLLFIEVQQHKTSSLTVDDDDGVVTAHT